MLHSVKYPSFTLTPVASPPLLSEPLLIPIRGVDAIISFDNSADTTYFYPNGTAPTTTYSACDAHELTPMRTWR